MLYERKFYAPTDYCKDRSSDQLERPDGRSEPTTMGLGHLTQEIKATVSVVRHTKSDQASSRTSSAEYALRTVTGIFGRFFAVRKQRITPLYPPSIRRDSSTSSNSVELTPHSPTSANLILVHQATVSVDRSGRNPDHCRRDVLLLALRARAQWANSFPPLKSVVDGLLSFALQAEVRGYSSDFF